ncbi:MAG: AmmeMemoRadiSam system protein B [Treponema sp.]|jgi:AmmeMemoRadiSam system protein B|nr:AmmeMemoRadiSam system protein B [Treponema sp.]
MEALLAQRKRVRCPVVAGVFYPEERKETLEYLRGLNTGKGRAGNAKAVIAPHGAWGLSGTLAARAFHAAAGREVSRVVIMGPVHDRRERGVFLSNSHSFQTPLGKIPVDLSLTKELELYGSYFETNDIPHLGEHSIEILLPFVKYCFPRASIVPVLMGQPNIEYISDLARALRIVVGPVLDDTLFVVSCNLSSSSDRAEAWQLAEETLRLFQMKDAPALTSAILESGINACGGALVAALFASGLLDNARPCFADCSIISAVGVENDTVYYGALSFE